MHPNIFEIAAMALHRCGYSVLPIMQGAKRPGTYRGFITEDGDGPWFGLKDWQEHCGALLSRIIGFRMSMAALRCLTVVWPPRKTFRDTLTRSLRKCVGR